VGYNSVSDNTGLSSFVYLLLPPNEKCREIPIELQQFKVIQRNRSWCQRKAHVWLPISQ